MAFVFNPDPGGIKDRSRMWRGATHRVWSEPPNRADPSGVAQTKCGYAVWPHQGHVFFRCTLFPVCRRLHARLRYVIPPG